MALTQADADLVATAVWNQQLGPVGKQTTAANTLTDTADQVGSGKSRYDGATRFLGNSLNALAADDTRRAESLAALTAAVNAISSLIQQGSGNPDTTVLVRTLAALSAQVTALQADLDATQSAVKQGASTLAAGLSGQ